MSDGGLSGAGLSGGTLVGAGSGGAGSGGAGSGGAGPATPDLTDPPGVVTALSRLDGLEGRPLGEHVEVLTIAQGG